MLPRCMISLHVMATPASDRSWLTECDLHACGLVTGGRELIFRASDVPGVRCAQGIASPDVHFSALQFFRRRSRI